jgi:hypothetical protein
MQRVGEPPRQHPTRRPVHDSHQIKEPAPHLDVDNAATPDVVRARDWQLPEKLGIDRVLGGLLARIWTFVDSL